MPELPEVESSRRLLESALVGQTIHTVKIAPDAIVNSGLPSEAFITLLQGASVTAAGRKGKFFWLELGDRGCLMAHLGMSGAIIELTPERQKAVHYKHQMATLENFVADPPTDVAHRAPYVKLRLDTESGRTVVMTDARRLGRLWIASSPDTDPRVSKLGPDAYASLPRASDLQQWLSKRKAPLKAVLLDQGFLAGIGNYLADEILYQAKLAPGRLANTLKPAQVKVLHEKITEVIHFVVEVDADYDHFPESWLFHYRWGGARGDEFIEGRAIVRETIGGRTTAWVPSVQK